MKPKGDEYTTGHAYRRTGLSLFIFLGGGGGGAWGGGIHIFGMFCQDRRIHARIRASGTRALFFFFFARAPKICCLLFQYRQRGTCRLLKFPTAHVDKQGGKKKKKKRKKKRKKKKKNRPNICPNYIRILPDFRPNFYSGNIYIFFGGGGGTVL